MKLIIAEKPSVAQTIAAALGVKEKERRIYRGRRLPHFMVRRAFGTACGSCRLRGSNIKNGVLRAYPFCRRNGSTPLTRTRGSNSKP